MTSSSNSSNSNLNREDSFTNLSDIIIGEKVETFSTTSQMTDQDIIAIKNKFEEFAFEITGLKKNNAELASELKKLKEVKAASLMFRFLWDFIGIYLKIYKIYFVKVSNKWVIWHYSTCCRYNCVKQETPNTTCGYGYGFIQITSNTNIKYNCKPVFRDNKEARIQAGYDFKKPESTLLCLNCSVYTLCYYEIKLQIEKRKQLIVDMGFRNTANDHFIYFCVSGRYISYFDNILKKTKFINLPLFAKNEDIIGCGVVYPPPNINNNKLPYIFFTKNGELIGKAIEWKGTNQNLYPSVILKFCSIETNFGEDLNSKPFKYDITNHIVTKEFYKDEEFSDE